MTGTSFAGCPSGAPAWRALGFDRRVRGGGCRPAFGGSGSPAGLFDRVDRHRGNGRAARRGAADGSEHPTSGLGRHIALGFPRVSRQQSASRPDHRQWRLTLIRCTLGRSRGGLAATNFPRRPHARDEATRRCRFPGLVRFRLRCTDGRRCSRLRRRRGVLFCGFGTCGRCLGAVPLETAALVLAAGAAMTRFIAPWPGTGWSSH